VESAQEKGFIMDRFAEVYKLAIESDDEKTVLLSLDSISVEDL
jgi:hypothetical protein